MTRVLSDHRHAPPIADTLSAVDCRATRATVVAKRRLLFTDEASVKCIVDALRQSDQEHRSRTFAWVVMPDHVHWLMQLRDDDLSR